MKLLMCVIIETVFGEYNLNCFVLTDALPHRINIYIERIEHKMWHFCYLQYMHR